MNFYALSGLLNGVASTALGLLVFSRFPSNPKHQAYGLYCLSLSLWSYCYFAWNLSKSGDTAMLFVRLLMIGAILIPITYLYHVLTLLESVDRHRTLLNIGILSTGVFLLADLTPFFVAKLEHELSFNFWPKPGPVFHVFLLWFAGAVSYATYLLGAASRHAEGYRRHQYRFLCIGAVIGYGGGATNFLLWYGIQIPPHGNVLVTVYTAMVAYTLIRYRLLDFTVAMEKSLTYLLLLFIFSVPSYGLLLIAANYFGADSWQFSLIFFMLFALIVGGAYQMKDWTQTAIARTLFRTRYDMYETLSKFSKALVTILDLKALTEEIVHTLVSVMGIQTASLYILDKEKDLYCVVSSHGLTMEPEKATTFSVVDELPYHLTRFQSILVLQELEEGPDFQKMQSLAGILRALQTEVCLPLVNKNRLIGFCNLGVRPSHRIYSDQDLRLLTTLTQEAAIALDNAMLYEDLKRSQILVQRTDRLRSLETIAEGFAHEVRNPLTSIKTFIQLAPTRKEDPDFLGRFSQVVSEDVTRIERLIQEIFDYARYMKPKFQEEDLNAIVESCLYVIEINFAKKSVFTHKELADDLPPVMVDRQQIKQILLNLFLNALEALPEHDGQLIVKTHRLNKKTGDVWVQMEVTDTGPGISPTDLEHIFDPFFTTKHASTEREGTGLGLTIVHQIVQEHSGYIEVSSQLGKGTTFLVNLPVKPHEFVEKKRTPIN